jgi:hypothetical protein
VSFKDVRFDLAKKKGVSKGFYQGVFCFSVGEWVGFVLGEKSGRR